MWKHGQKMAQKSRGFPPCFIPLFFPIFFVFSFFFLFFLPGFGSMMADVAVAGAVVAAWSSVWLYQRSMSKACWGIGGGMPSVRAAYVKSLTGRSTPDQCQGYLR